MPQYVQIILDRFICFFTQALVREWEEGSSALQSAGCRSPDFGSYAAKPWGILADARLSHGFMMMFHHTSHNY
jgi:hypothetical protein